MNVRFYIAFQLEFGMKQLFFSREKGGIDFDSKLIGTDIRYVKREKVELLGLYLMTENPTLKEIEEGKKLLWDKLLKVVPQITSFRPKCYLYREKFIGL